MVVEQNPKMIITNNKKETEALCLQERHDAPYLVTLLKVFNGPVVESRRP